MTLTAFARSIFRGGASEMRVSGLIVEIRCDGKDVHDPLFVAEMRRQWGKIGAKLITAKLLAGTKEDGRPSSQWCRFPEIRLEELPSYGK